jgi:hypothetical protein
MNSLRLVVALALAMLSAGVASLANAQGAGADDR